MASIFGRYIEGQRAAQQKQERTQDMESRKREGEQRSEFRGLQMKDLLGDIKRKESQAKRKDRFGELAKQRRGAETPQERRSFASEMQETSPEMWTALNTFESDQEAEQANRFGESAAVASQYIGTPNEAAGMDLWARGRMEGGANPDRVSEAMGQYNSLQGQEKTLFAQNLIESDLAQGMGAQKYLATKKAPAAKDRRIVTGADKMKYYEDTGERVLPDVERVATGPSTVVNVGAEAGTGLSSDMITSYTDARKVAESARADEKKYDKLLDVISKVDTGTFAEAKLEGVKLLKALGVDVDSEAIANAEELKSLVIGEVLDKVGQTKGAISEKEMALFQAASINLGNTPEGNALIAKAAIGAARRERKLAEGIAKFIRSNRDNEDFSVFDIEDEKDRIRAELAETPIFTKKEMEKLREIGGDVDLISEEDLGAEIPILKLPAPNISSDADYNALESGSRFTDPEGNIRIKP